MTVTKLAAVLALGALACGGGDKQAQQEQAPAVRTGGPDWSGRRGEDGGHRHDVRAGG
jgi:hypothetical protein